MAGDILFDEFPDASYDCVDRVVLRAYFQLGQRAPGFRMWRRWLAGIGRGAGSARIVVAAVTVGARDVVEDFTGSVRGVTFRGGGRRCSPSIDAERPHEMIYARGGQPVSEARQPDAQQDEGEARSAEREVMRLLEEALDRYEDIMELADLEDALGADTAHPTDYSWDNPIGLVIREGRHGHLV